MDTEQNVGGRDRLVRLLLTAVLSVAAVRWLRSGKRLRGLLAGVGALGLGFNVTTGYCGVNDALDVDTTVNGVSIDFDDDETAEDGQSTAASDDTGKHSLTCAACGEPIVPGQNRGPNSNDEIVHDACA